MSNIRETLAEMMAIDGALAAALVDWGSGMTLGVAGGGPSFDIELAAAGNANVVKAKMEVMRSLKLTGGIEDMMMTLESQIHIIRPIGTQSLFVYLALDKSKSNLALARLRLRALCGDLKI